MQNKDNIIFTGGLNKDDDPRFMPKGDYFEAKNIIVGTNQDAENTGLVQKVKSTLDFTLDTPSGSIQSKECYGVATDEENDLAYLFFRLRIIDDGVFEKFVIIKHDIEAATSKIIFNRDLDDWNIKTYAQTQQRFYNPVILDGKLIWTDNENDIRLIDVNRMETTTDAGITGTVARWDSRAGSLGASVGTYFYYADSVYEVIQNPLGISDPPPDAPAYYEFKCLILDCYLDINDPNNFTLAALPPLIAPNVKYGSDSTKKVNQLRYKTFQFSYRYIYLDWRKSTYASPSEIAPPDREENILGEPNPDYSLNNFIEVKVNSGNEEVRAIDIIARDSSDNTTWYKAGQVVIVDDAGNRNYKADTNVIFYFYNNIKEAVNQTDVFNLFSYVPIKAKHQELIEGNRLVYGNITEGYGKQDVLIDFDLSWETLESTATENVPYTLDEYKRTEYTPPASTTHIWYLRHFIPEINPGACTFVFSLKQETGLLRTVQYVYNGTDTYPDTVKAGLSAAIEAEWGSNEISTPPALIVGNTDYIIYSFKRTDTSSAFKPYEDWEYEGIYTIPVAGYVNKYKSLLMGSTHSWGVLYRDKAGRTSPIMGTENFNLYIPNASEDSSISYDQIPIVDFKIDSNPPEWAESYEIVYGGNSTIDYFINFIGYTLSHGKTFHDSISDIDDTTNPNWRVDLASALNNSRDRFNNWSVEQYVWQRGDRIRVLYKVDNLGTFTEQNVLFDSEIIGVFTDKDGATEEAAESKDWLYFRKIDGVDLNPSVPSTNDDNIYFQIYRLKQQTTIDLYYTTGMTFDIDTDVYGNKYHTGDTNQVLDSGGVSVTPAIIRNTSHDAWKYYRVFRNELNAATWNLWAESQYASDWYFSQELTSSGLPIPALDSLQQNVMSKRLRHGGVINIGTQTNNLSDFGFADFVDLKDQDGPIEGLRLVGFVLKAIQYTKVSSIYIGRTESFNAEGNSDYQFTNNVFGTVRPAMEDWGTSHPESVIVHNRHLYFWDQSEGIVVRDAANGMIAISDIKMKRYFTEKAKELDAVSRSNQWIVFSYSVETEELFCTFGTAITTDKEIVAFNEDKKRWTRIMDVPFDRGAYYWFGKRLFLTTNLQVLEFHRGADYLVIGGDAKTGTLDFYSSELLTKPKIFNSIVVYQTGDDPRFNDITIPEKATAVTGEMRTFIYPVNIEEKEGIFYCRMLNDLNDPRPLSNNEKLVNGRYLRGLYAKISMKYIGSTETTLSNVVILSTPSERSL